MVPKYLNRLQAAVRRAKRYQKHALDVGITCSCGYGHRLLAENGCNDPQFAVETLTEMLEHVCEPPIRQRKAVS